MSGRGRGAVRPLCALAVLVGVGGSVLGADRPARQVIGVLSVQGEVWTQEADRAAREMRVPGAGTALLESTRLRTAAAGGAALLTLSQDGVVGLRAESRAEVGAKGPDGSRIDLLAGEALVRLPAGSRLTLTTPTAAVRAERIQPAATGATRPNEASVRITPDGQTIVRVESGTVRVESRPGGGETLVRAGEQATIEKSGAPRIVAVSTTAGMGALPAPAAATGSAGIFGTDAAMAGLAAVGVAAGTLGGLGASGTLGGGGGSSSNDTTGQGSPFKPHPPHPPRPPGHGPGS